MLLYYDSRGTRAGRSHVEGRRRFVDIRFLERSALASDSLVDAFRLRPVLGPAEGVICSKTIFKPQIK